MRVVYVKTMVERIQDARHLAMVGRRKIEKIVLSFDEAEQLAAELVNPYLIATNLTLTNWLYLARHFPTYVESQPKLTVMGIDINISR
jgi:hypothetical protein